MADRSRAAFADFLERSLEVIEREAPQHFAALRAALRGSSVRIEVEGDPAVRVQLDVRPFIGPAAHAEVTVAVAGRDVAELLRGGLVLDQAIEDERLRLHGALDPLLGFLDALGVWLHGAVRCPSLPRLYREYLARTAPSIA